MAGLLAGTYALPFVGLGMGRLSRLRFEWCRGSSNLTKEDFGIEEDTVSQKIACGYACGRGARKN
ncbi:MAG TPA: hypothetical protein VGO27_21425 [Candidatus Acidoferrum sp.]|jgi:hypothetical protein|nr:hypothetical protein [Candidatus Acidoferrum sp.]